MLDIVQRFLILSEALQNRINILQTLADFRLRLGAGEHNFSIYKNQQHHARLHHTINEAGKQFRFVRAELSMHLIEVLQSYRKTEINGGDQILYFKIHEFHL